MSSIASGTTTTTGLVYTSDTSGNLVLQTNGTTTAVTIDTSQNVGIGVTPSSGGLSTYKLLEIGTNANGSLYSGSNQMLIGTNIAWSGGTANYKASGLFPCLYNQQNGQHQWSYAASGTAGGTITFTNAMTLNNSGTFLFNTTSVTSAGLVTPVFQIAADAFSSGASAGYFWENRTTTATANANWYGWYTTSGVIYLYNGSGNAASINPSTGAYTALSDINFKKDISASTLGLNEILKLKPSFYRMKTDAETDPLHLGFIAQDVQSVIPQAYVEIQNDETCATGQPSTFIGLNDRAIIATLVSAIQELSAKVTALEAKVA